MVFIPSTKSVRSLILKEFAAFSFCLIDLSVICDRYCKTTMVSHTIKLNKENYQPKQLPITMYAAKLMKGEAISIGSIVRGLSMARNSLLRVSRSLLCITF